GQVLAGAVGVEVVDQRVHLHPVPAHDGRDGDEVVAGLGRQQRRLRVHDDGEVAGTARAAGVLDVVLADVDPRLLRGDERDLAVVDDLDLGDAVELDGVRGRVCDAVAV